MGILCAGAVAGCRLRRLLLFTLIGWWSLGAASTPGADPAAVYADLAHQETQRAGQWDYDRALANAALAAGEIEHALFVLERIRLLYPHDMEARIDLVRLYLRLGDIQRAQQILREIPLDQAPDTIRARLTELKKLLYRREKKPNRFSFAAWIGYQTNPAGTPDSHDIQLNTGYILYPEPPRPSAYIQYRLTAIHQAPRRQIMLSVQQRHYQVGHTSRTRLYLHYQWPLTSDLQGQLMLTHDRQDTYRTLIESGLNTRPWQPLKPCELVVGGYLRYSQSDLAYIPDHELILQARTRCQLSAQSTILSLDLRGSQVFADTQSPLDKALQLNLQLSTLNPPYRLTISWGWAQQWDRYPWFPPFFASLHRNLNTQWTSASLQYTIHNNLAIGVHWQQRQYHASIPIYQSKDEEASLYVFTTW